MASKYMAPSYALLTLTQFLGEKEGRMGDRAAGGAGGINGEL